MIDLLCETIKNMRHEELTSDVIVSLLNYIKLYPEDKNLHKAINEKLSEAAEVASKKPKNSKEDKVEANKGKGAQPQSK